MICAPSIPGAARSSFHNRTGASTAWCGSSDTTRLLRCSCRPGADRRSSLGNLTPSGRQASRGPRI
jgi:hypothetical protein